MSIFTKIKKYKWLINVVLQTSSEDRKNLIAGYKARRRFYTCEGIDADLKEMAKCAMCPNMCRFDCPALMTSKRETYSPANKTRIAYFMGMKHVPMDNPSAINTLYACMNCDACKHWCAMKISTGDCLIEMRQELGKRNLVPEKFGKLKERIKQNGSIFDQTLYTKDSEFNIDMPNPQIFYFIGCMSAKNRPSTVRATIALLKQLNIPFATRFADRKCCGSPSWDVGYTDDAKTCAQENTSLINKTGASIILSDCPGCTSMLATNYPKLGQKLKGKVVHTSQFFSEQIKAGKIKPQTPIKSTVTYHDPCVLARKLEQGETSNDILKAIPGLIIKEPYLHGKETQCCGYGGAYHVSNEQFSDETGQKRLVQLRKFQPDVILSACPTCEYAIQKAQEKSPAKKPEAVKDVIELLAESCGLKY